MSESPAAINQSDPAYQDALQKIVALSQDQAAFMAKIKELGMETEYSQTIANIANLQPQGIALQEKAQQLQQKVATEQERIGKYAKKAGIWSTVVGLALGVGASFKGSRLWSKGLIGVGVALVTGAITALTFGHFGKKKVKASEEQMQSEAQVLQVERDRIVITALEFQKPFMEAMAMRLMQQEQVQQPDMAAHAVQAPSPEVAAAPHDNVMKIHVPVTLEEAAKATQPLGPYESEKAPILPPSPEPHTHAASMAEKHAHQQTASKVEALAAQQARETAAGAQVG